MSSDGSITLAFGDGEHTFRLRMKELRELQEKCDAGFSQILLRLGSVQCKIDDVTETLRLGLIGGGTEPMLALGLVSKYVGPVNLLKHQLIACDVLAAALFGDPRDAVGKLVAELSAAREPTTTMETNGSGSRPSSEAVPQWDGHLVK
jgi:Phage tail tube protein, GTA-gp10